MRVAIIASPRSGNSWLKKLLADTLGLEEFAVHNWHEVINQLPESCLLQIHWYREPGFQMFLRDNGFKIVTITRHPLDILLSVLRFCKYDQNNARWLEGNCNLDSLFEQEVSPTCPAFLNWCTSFGCENLLSVTYQWFHEPDVLKVRFEELLHNPRETINTLASRIVGTSISIPDAVLEKYNLLYWKSLPNKHGWQGKAGLWKELYSRRTCRAIYERHQRVFDVLGYGIDDAMASNSFQKIAERWKELTAEDPPPPPPPKTTFISSLLAGRKKELVS